MKKNFKLIIAFLFLQSFTALFCLASNLFNYPEDSPSIEILNNKLNANDLPGNPEFRGQCIIRDPKFAGWIRKPSSQIWDDFAPGLAESWKIGTTYYAFRYGFFQNSNEAQMGAQNVIEANLGMESDPVTLQNITSFNGQVFGDKTFSWDSQMEKQYGAFDKGINGQPFPTEYAGLAFAKGKYAFAIHAGADFADGGVDKRLMETLAEKASKKIDVSIALGNFGNDLSKLVSQQGILRSLQAKLDAFTKNFRKGEYKTALNDINSFVNELNAQRGKHVSEQAYQTLKSYAETIITNVNSLM